MTHFQSPPFNCTIKPQDYRPAEKTPPITKATFSANFEKRTHSGRPSRTRKPEPPPAGATRTSTSSKRTGGAAIDDIGADRGPYRRHLFDGEPNVSHAGFSGDATVPGEREGAVVGKRRFWRFLATRRSRRGLKRAGPFAIRQSRSSRVI